MEQQLTLKAQETRQRIFDVAIRLFIEKGYEETTMRDIAAAADCALGLPIKYFQSKEGIVIALYRRNLSLTEGRVQNLPSAPLAERFHQTMTGILEDVKPHREAYAGVFGAAMNPHSSVGVLGEHTADIRYRMRAAFAVAVSGASDTPKQPQQVEQITILLYAAHFLLLLFWISDGTPDQRATYQLLDFSRDTLNLVRPALILPPVTRSLARIAGILEAVFGGQKADDQR
jgi:AcrR family transcriptional regulator